MPAAQLTCGRGGRRCARCRCGWGAGRAGGARRCRGRCKRQQVGGRAGGARRPGPCRPYPGDRGRGRAKARCPTASPGLPRSPAWPGGRPRAPHPRPGHRRRGPQSPAGVQPARCHSPALEVALWTLGAGLALVPGERDVPGEEARLVPDVPAGEQRASTCSRTAEASAGLSRTGRRLGLASVPPRHGTATPGRPLGWPHQPGVSAAHLPCAHVLLEPLCPEIHCASCSRLLFSPLAAAHAHSP